MDNENLLNSIYQNIAMVLETIPEIRKITTDCDFKALIISQEEEYQNLSDSIKDTITSNGDSTEELNDLLKTYSEWMTKLKAMSDKNVSHLSEMCIQGYTMGMIKAIQKIHINIMPPMLKPPKYCKHLPNMQRPPFFLYICSIQSYCVDWM